MKVTPRSLHTNTGTHTKQNKSKKSKTPRKGPKEGNNGNIKDESKALKERLAPNNKDVEFIPDGSSEGTPFDSKRNQVEKRKQDNSDWKSCKKIDYQRLETVLEEGQLSAEEAKDTEDWTESDSDLLEVSADLLVSKKRRTCVYDLVPISEQSEFFWKGEHEKGHNRSREASEKGDALAGGKRVDVLDMYALDTETNSLSTKRNGMMEILPIFSNDKFACSRDAISIEEYEDLTPEAPEKRGDGIKKEGPDDTTVGGGPKDLIDRKLRYKMLTDRALPQKTSSQFINSLLVLTPFAKDREKFSRDGGSHKAPGIGVEPLFLGPRRLEPVEGEYLMDLRPVPVIIYTTIGLVTVAVALAWKSYQPPCIMDYIFELLPFGRRRRSCAQLLVDELLKILYNIIGST